MAKELIGKEAELGEYGKASISVNSLAEVILKVEAKVDILAELEKLAAKTNTKLDDQVVAYLKGIIQAANSVTE